MRNIPRFAFLAGEGFIGMKVICLEYPYIIGSVFPISMDDTEKLDEMITEMVQSGGVAKVRDFSVFVKSYESLEPCQDKGHIQRVLNDMAEYVREERILKKTGQFKSCDEKGIIKRRTEKAIERHKSFLAWKEKNKEDN